MKGGLLNYVVSPSPSPRPLVQTERERNSFLDDVLFLCTHKRHQFVFLSLRHFILIKRRNQMFGGGVSIRFRNSEARMRGLHVAAHVNARPARRDAKLIQTMLPHALL